MKTSKAIAAFLDAKRDLSPRTLEQYGGALDYLVSVGRKLPSKPRPIRDALHGVNSDWVRDVDWRVWKSFFHWCSGEYGVPNPMDRVERPRLPEIEMRVLEPAELATVLAAARSVYEKAIVALALDSGLRASEFGTIRVSDVGTNTIFVWGKGRKRLQVPVSPETRHLLQLLIDHDGKEGPHGLLFAGKDGKPLSRFAVYRVVRQCMDRAGIAGPKRGSHCLRHSLGTNWVAAGGDPFTLKRIMRHTNIATTQKYVNLAMHTVVEHHRQYSPLRDAIRGAQGVLIDREIEEIMERK